MKEKEDDILGRMLRALAASGPNKSTAISTVTKAAKSHKEARVRAHAIVGVGKIEKREAVTASLRAGLQDEDALVRTVTAYVIAIRQDKALLDHLVTSLQAETEDSVKAWFEKAINAVKSGDTKAFKDFLPKILDGNEPGSELDRLREMAEDFDRGDGGNKDGEDKDKKGKDGDKKKEKK
jgi:HEAT repeat protein